MQGLGAFICLCLAMCVAVVGVMLLQRVVPRLFRPRDPLRCGAVLWWELRRIPYNLVIGGYGIACLLVFFWGITTSGELRPGEDAVEPLALFAAPFIANVCYTAGWVVELFTHLLIGPSPQIGTFLFKLGLGFSLFVISIPAIIWASIGVFHLCFGG
jgi:hypothetical protein